MLHMPHGGPYVSILIDPPWDERGGGKIKRGVDRHYETTRARDIPELIKSSPLWNPNTVGCSVWLWATLTNLMVAGKVLDALGARYVTHVVWNKIGAPGLGQRVRGAHETLLLGIIGRVPVPLPGRRVRSTFDAARPCHPGTRRAINSGKPNQQYLVVETHDPPGPRAELFARKTRQGWDSWGDQLVVGEQ